ncbi:hypothetical protein, partial [Actinoalloteichus caeruleus]
AVRFALETLVARHETLRTTFDTVEGRGVQVVGPVESPLRVVDLSTVPERQRPGLLEHRLREEVETPFDLRNGP